MTDRENNEYIEDRDILGQHKSHNTNRVNRNRWSVVLLLLFGLSLTAVTIYNLAFKDYRKAFYYPDGTIKSRGDFNSIGQGIGLHTDYWEDGSTHRETNFNDKGKLHGISRRWNRNGVLVSEIDYLDGKLNGHFKRWDDNGNLIVHEVYQADTLVKRIK